MRGFPAQTTFHLSPDFGDFGFPSLLLERGAHKPSPADFLAPFYPDPSQRIVVLHFPSTSHYFVFQVGSLFRFLESHEGSGVPWYEWGSRVIIPSSRTGHLGVQVSGCRLLSMSTKTPIRDVHMKVYDFSTQGRGKHLSERRSGGLGIVKHMSATKARVRIPYSGTVSANMHGGHDSVILLHVSDTASHPCLVETE